MTDELEGSTAHTLSFDFNNLHLGFCSKITRTLERAAFLLNAANTVTENVGLVPDVDQPAIPIKVEARPLEEV